MSQAAMSPSDVKLLPWLVNGTLGRDEREKVKQALREHEELSRELGATLDAYALFGRHPSTETLVDVAFGTPTADPEGLELHLAHCPDCAAQLALARRSAALREAGIRRPLRPAPVAGWWRHAAIAAALAGLVVGGGWLQSLHNRADSVDLASTEASIAAELEALRAPASVQWIELQAPTITRSAGDAPTTVTMPADPAQPVVLVLEALDLSADLAPYTVELRDSHDALVFTLSDLTRNLHGEYTIKLPYGNLQPGTYSAQIFGQGVDEAKALERYTFRVAS